MYQAILVRGHKSPPQQIVRGLGEIARRSYFLDQGLINTNAQTTIVNGNKDWNIIVEIWHAWMRIVRQSRRHPELHFDVARRGPVRGFLFSIAGHLAYRWLVELKAPSDFS